MDKKTCEDGEQNVSVIETGSAIDKSTIPSIVPARKESICGDQNLDCKIALVTPEKVDEYFKGKSKEHMIKLQEKCQPIVEFFDCLTSSLRLLNLREKLSTFHNICCQVAVMAKRKFLHRHLAQIIYIIPEAVHIDKVIIHDKKTLCMKPDMVISLKFDIVEGHQEHSDFLALRKVFSSRIMKYFVAHPEKSDVPEGTLPEPFNHTNELCLDQLYDTSSEKSLPVSVGTNFSSEESWPHPSIKRHFSLNVVSETGISESVASPVVLSSTTACSLNEDSNNDRLHEGFTDLCCKSDTVTDQGIKSDLEKDSCRATSAAISPAQPISPQVAADSSESPLFKPLISAPSILIQTPTQLTPKRSMPSSDVKARTITSTETLSKPAKRFLNFSGLEDDKGALSSSLDDSLCCEISQSTHKFSSDGNITGSLAVSLKEEETQSFLDEHFQKNHTSEEICQESSGLPDLARVIYYIFKSVNRFSITKEELMHKIIMNSLDITERREVEEKIEQLEKLVPDWISRKSTSSGDVTFNLNTTGDLESVLTKIVHI